MAGFLSCRINAPARNRFRFVTLRRRIVGRAGPC
jgi:hypothetical protein